MKFNKNLKIISVSDRQNPEIKIKIKFNTNVKYRFQDTFFKAQHELGQISGKFEVLRYWGRIIVLREVQCRALDAAQTGGPSSEKQFLHFFGMIFFCWEFWYFFGMFFLQILWFCGLIQLQLTWSNDIDSSAYMSVSMSNLKLNWKRESHNQQIFPNIILTVKLYPNPNTPSHQVQVHEKGAINPNIFQLLPKLFWSDAPKFLSLNQITTIDSN